MVKYDSFQIYRVHPDRVIQKTWQLMTNLKTSEFDLSHIKQCVKKKKIFVRHIKVAKQLLNSTFLKKIQKQPLRCRSSHQRCLEVLLKICKTSKENTCVGVFFMKLQAFSLQRFLKRDSNTMISCEVCQTFKNTYFEVYVQTTASGGVH